LAGVKIVAQKPSGRVMPAALPLQSFAWVGVVADHDISIITAATKTLRPPDRRAMKLIDDKYLDSIVHPTCPQAHLEIHIAAPP
jgi:hypothetical protein